MTVLKAAAKTAGHVCGVYQLLDNSNKILYIGKARYLDKRLLSYTRAPLSAHQTNWLKRVSRVETLQTDSESEALLLEAHLIKTHRPPHNILLKDDKSYPYIRLVPGKWPRLEKYRGRKKDKKTLYFGPFSSSKTVKQTLKSLQKAFPLRSCTDREFANRSRPCLLHQLGQCSAPCVGLIPKTDYDHLVKDVTLFLRGGKGLKTLLSRYQDNMENAAEQQLFEYAALLRNRLRALSKIQIESTLGIGKDTDVDVIGLYTKEGCTTSEVLIFRGGQYLGNCTGRSRHSLEDTPEAIGKAFLFQWYQSHPIPHEIYISLPLKNTASYAKALSLQYQKNVSIKTAQRGKPYRCQQQAVKYAKTRLLQATSTKECTAELKSFLGIKSPSLRIEVYDNSHIAGTYATGSMIVATEEGTCPSAYRQFHLSCGKDDYAMMRDVLKRRFKKPSSSPLPDIVLIDGGRAHGHLAYQALHSMGLDKVCVLAIGKGLPRQSEDDKIWHLPKKNPISLPKEAFYLLQRLRDEAHRYALARHSHRRTKGYTTSLLDTIPGIGKKRKQALLLRFGTPSNILSAGIEHIATTPGLSKKTATTLYHYLKPLPKIAP